MVKDGKIEVDETMDNFPIYSWHPFRHSKLPAARPSNEASSYPIDLHGIKSKLKTKTLPNLGYGLSLDKDDEGLKIQTTGRSHTQLRDCMPNIEKCEGFYNFKECFAEDSDAFNTTSNELVSEPRRINMLRELQSQLPLPLNYEMRPLARKTEIKENGELISKKCYHQSVHGSELDLYNVLKPKESVMEHSYSHKRVFYPEIKESMKIKSYNNVEEANSFSSLRASKNDSRGSLSPSSSISVLVDGMDNCSVGYKRAPSLNYSSKSKRKKDTEYTRNRKNSFSTEKKKEAAEKIVKIRTTMFKDVGSERLHPGQVESLGSLWLDASGNSFAKCRKSKSLINICSKDRSFSPQSGTEKTFPKSNMSLDALPEGVVNNPSIPPPPPTRAAPNSRKRFIVMDCHCSIPRCQSRLIRWFTCTPSNHCTGCENCCQCLPCSSFCGMPSCCPRLEKLQPTIGPREYCCDVESPPPSPRPYISPPPRPSKPPPRLPPKPSYMNPLPPTPRKSRSNHFAPPSPVPMMYNPCMYSCCPCPCPCPVSYTGMQYQVPPAPTSQYMPLPHPQPQLLQYSSQNYQQPYRGPQMKQAFVGKSQSRSRFRIPQSQSPDVQNSWSPSPLQSASRRGVPTSPLPTSHPIFGTYVCNCMPSCCLPCCIPTTPPSVPSRRLRYKRSRRRQKSPKRRKWQA